MLTCKYPIKLAAVRTRAKAREKRLWERKHGLRFEIANDQAMGAQRMVSCGRCHNCRMNERYALASRLVSEMSRCKEPCWFFTLTYKPDKLPMTAGREAGELSENQLKLKAKLEAKLEKHISERTDYRCREILGLLAQGHPPMPTIRFQDIQSFKKAAKRALGAMPRMFIVSEMGTHTERPHYHGVIFGQPEAVVVKILACWQNVYGIAEAEIIRDEGAADYVTKDMTKGSDHKLAYIARGQEHPRWYPMTPALASEEADEIVKLLKVVQKTMSDQEFVDHLMGGYWEHGNGGPVQKGGRLGTVYRKNGHIRRYGRTAHAKALQKIDLGDGSINLAKEKADDIAYEATARLDPTSVLYDPEAAAFEKAKRVKAQGQSRKMQRNHRKILERKRHEYTRKRDRRIL